MEFGNLDMSNLLFMEVYNGEQPRGSQGSFCFREKPGVAGLTAAVVFCSVKRYCATTNYVHFEWVLTHAPYWVNNSVRDGYNHANTCQSNRS